MRPTPTNAIPPESLSAWLDGELDEAAVSELEAELARDPALRADLEELEAVVRTVREDGPVSAPAGFDARVMARIAREFPEEDARWAWLRRPFGIPLEGWALGLAAVAVVLLVLPVWHAAAPDDGDERSLSPAAVEAPAATRKGEDAREKEDPAPPVPSESELAPGLVPDAVADASGTEAAEGVPGRKATFGGKEPPLGTPTGGEEVATGVDAVLAPAPTGAGEPEIPAAAGTAEGGEAVALGPESHQLVVRSGSTAVERDLLKVCGRYFWKCAAAAGATDGKMTASRETVVVTLPQRDLALLARELEALGHDVQRIGDDDPVRGGDVSIPVVLQLVGGGASPDAADEPAAARKAMDPAEAR